MYLEFLILACTIYILAKPQNILQKWRECHPNEIFQIYEELSKFSEKEIEEAIKETRIGDAIGMSYITAIEMKKIGRWDTYLEEWEKNKDKTGRERLEKYLHERGLDYMLNVNRCK
ncbi:MAG: hypothetical protein ACLUN0_09890 [Roseburia sp.]